MQLFSHTLRTAHQILRAAYPRAGYAHHVLDGAQRWSGSDLQGKANRYGAGYARQRRHALLAWDEAGGEVRSIGNSGLLVSVIPIGQDDYGSALYMTRRGTVWTPRARASYRLIKVY